MKFSPILGLSGMSLGTAAGGTSGSATPRQPGANKLSTGKVQCFAAGYLRMHRKYKILWFELDLHHRQRYFSICGCNRTLMMFGANHSAISPTTEENSR